MQRFTPLLIDAARPCRYAAGDRWFMDETYVRVAGRWVSLSRAIDQDSQFIDMLVSPKWDLAATRRFFIRALNDVGNRSAGEPHARFSGMELETEFNRYCASSLPYSRTSECLEKVANGGPLAFTPESQAAVSDVTEWSTSSFHSATVSTVLIMIDFCENC